jgi:hypothetical protein
LILADRVINVITPATDYNLVSLDEIKLMFGILETDSSQDDLLNEYISQYSDVIATYCNRVFAKEELYEIWRCTEYDQTNGMKRLFLSHYPLDKTYNLVLESPTGSTMDPEEYAIEWKSGKIELLQTNTEPIKVTYSGGYLLPTETPPALKQAAMLMIREGQALMQRLAVSGIRSISHKDSRVMYFDAKQQVAFGQAGAGLINSVTNNLLMHYVRFEV